MNRYFLFFIFFTIILSCYTRKEGCSDTLSTNFDVTIDDACSQCCKYPKIIVKIDHFAGDSIFDNKNTYINQYNQKYQLQDIRFYLSNVKLYQKNNIFTITEKITTTVGDQLNDDVKLCRLSDTEIVFGSKAAYGKFDSLNLLAGITNNYANADFTGLSTDHPLYKKNRLTNADGKNIHCSYRLIIIGTEPKTLNLSISADITPVQINIDSCIITTKGNDFVFKIKFDYLKLFENVDLSGSSVEIEKGAEKNFGRIFRVK